MWEPGRTDAEPQEDFGSSLCTGQALGQRGLIANCGVNCSSWLLWNDTLAWRWPGVCTGEKGPPSSGGGTNLGRSWATA